MGIARDGASCVELLPHESCACFYCEDRRSVKRILFQERFGFQPARQWGLHDEYQGGDAFQALEIRPDSIPRGAGLIRYAPEFNAFTSEG